MKKIRIFTLFPEVLRPYLSLGIVGSVFAGKRGPELSCELIDLRQFGIGKHQSVDDSPYGGGPGMVLRADVLHRALEETLEYPESQWKNRYHMINLSPSGTIWDQSVAKAKGEELLSEDKEWVIICGRYEGIDQRFIDEFIDCEYSIGDYVLSGGELPCLIMIDSVVRLLPGVLPVDSAHQESFTEGLLDVPVYTRPRTFQGKSVPSVLLSGDHQAIATYVQSEQMEITKERRIDLYQRYIEEKSYEL